MKLCRLRVASPCATAVTSSGMERRMDDLQSSNAVEGCAPVQTAQSDPVTQLSHFHSQGHATGKSNTACCNSMERRSALTQKPVYNQASHNCKCHQSICNMHHILHLVPGLHWHCRSAAIEQQLELHAHHLPALKRTAAWSQLCNVNAQHTKQLQILDFCCYPARIINLNAARLCQFQYRCKMLVDGSLTVTAFVTLLEKMQDTIMSTPHLSWVFPHVSGFGTAWQPQSTILLSILAVHLQVMHSLCTLLLLPITLGLELDQETQNSCHIQYLYLGVLECIYNSFKGCKADPAEAHVHKCTA